MSNMACFVFPNGKEQKLFYDGHTNLQLEMPVARDNSHFNMNYIFTVVPFSTEMYHERYIIVEICNNKYYLEQVK